jgi:hypothetical protein
MYSPVFGHVVQHGDGSWCDFDDPGVAAFYWVVYSDGADFFVYVDPFQLRCFGGLAAVPLGLGGT